MIKRATIRFCVETAAVSLLSVALFLTALQFFAKPFRVEGMSMEPLLHDGDLILVRRCYSPPVVKRGEVVIIRAPGGGFAVKRVAAVAGDEISVSGGRLFVNGKSESKMAFSDGGPDAEHAKTTLGKGCVYLLGDNRGKSLDSRAWGAVPVDTIYGKPLFLDGAVVTGRTALKGSR